MCVCVRCSVGGVVCAVWNWTKCVCACVLRERKRVREMEERMWGDGTKRSACVYVVELTRARVSVSLSMELVGWLVSLKGGILCVRENVLLDSDKLWCTHVYDI